MLICLFVRKTDFRTRRISRRFCQKSRVLLRDINIVRVLVRIPGVSGRIVSKLLEARSCKIKEKMITVERPLFSAGSARQRHDTSHTFMDRNNSRLMQDPPARFSFATDIALLLFRSFAVQTLSRTRNAKHKHPFITRLCRTLLLNSWQAWARGACASIVHACEVKLD